jgi:hypothetical protein
MESKGIKSLLFRTKNRHSIALANSTPNSSFQDSLQTTKLALAIATTKLYHLLVMMLPIEVGVSAP